MEEELNNKHTVSFDVIKKDILIDDENNKGSKRELNDIEWENFMKILNSNSNSYIDRCLWVLSQIKDS